MPGARVSAFTIALVAACTPDFGSARSVAEAFVDRYYVEADFVRALDLTGGGARERLENEQRLAHDARGGGGAPPAALHSRVYREQADMLEEGQDRAALQFRLRVQPNQGATFFKSVTVTLARRDARWSVVDMTEASAR